MWTAWNAVKPNRGFSSPARAWGIELLRPVTTLCASIRVVKMHRCRSFGGVITSYSIHYTKLYEAHITFQKDSKMENIRALGIVKSIEKLCSGIETVPADLLGDHSDDEITANGFDLLLTSDQPGNVILSKIKEAFFINNIQFEQVAGQHSDAQPVKKQEESTNEKADIAAINAEVSSYNFV